VERVFEVTSHEPIWIRDINHDGRFEIGNNYAIGVDMCHAAQPRWTDIYGYENERFRNVNYRFRRRFRSWPHKLRTSLKQYPDDCDVREYLGIAEAIVGHSAAARRELKKTIVGLGKAFRERKHSKDDPYSPASYQRDVRRLKARIRLAITRRVQDPPYDSSTAR